MLQKVTYPDDGRGSRGPVRNVTNVQKQLPDAGSGWAPALVARTALGCVAAPGEFMHAAETESDGDCEATDITQIQTWIHGSAYDVRGDLDLDGDVDTTDKSTAQGSFQGMAMGWRGLSGLANRRGYSGYERPESLATLWLVRNRLFNSEAGSWSKRDPLGYVDAASLYVYVRSAPTRFTDPFGLHSNLQECLDWAEAELVVCETAAEINSEEHYFNCMTEFILVDPLIDCEAWAWQFYYDEMDICSE